MRWGDVDIMGCKGCLWNPVSTVLPPQCKDLLVATCSQAKTMKRTLTQRIFGSLGRKAGVFAMAREKLKLKGKAKQQQQSNNNTKIIPSCQNRKGKRKGKAASSKGRKHCTWSKAPYLTVPGPCLCVLLLFMPSQCLCRWVRFSAFLSGRSQM